MFNKGIFFPILGRHPNCRLLLKTRNLSCDHLAKEIIAAVRECPKITLIDQSLSSIEMFRLIQSCDIYLSLHRAEGFGLVIAEAMALGKPVVATGWSGNMDFMCEDTAAVVPFKLVPVSDSSGVDSRPAFYCAHQMPVHERPGEHHPIAEDIAARGISLPSHPTLTDDVILEVVSAVRAALSEA